MDIIADEVKQICTAEGPGGSEPADLHDEERES
jgi:hypothetical protein